MRKIFAYSYHKQCKRRNIELLVPRNLKGEHREKPFGKFTWTRKPTGMRQRLQREEARNGEQECRNEEKQQRGWQRPQLKDRKDSVWVMKIVAKTEGPVEPRIQVTECRLQRRDV